MKIILSMLLFFAAGCIQERKEYFFPETYNASKPIYHDQSWKDSDGGWRPGQSVE